MSSGGTGLWVRRATSVRVGRTDTVHGRVDLSIVPNSCPGTHGHSTKFRKHFVALDRPDAGPGEQPSRSRQFPCVEPDLPGCGGGRRCPPLRVCRRPKLRDGRDGGDRSLDSHPCSHRRHGCAFRGDVHYGRQLRNRLRPGKRPSLRDELYLQLLRGRRGRNRCCDAAHGCQHPPWLADGNHVRWGERPCVCGSVIFEQRSRD